MELQTEARELSLYGQWISLIASIVPSQARLLPSGGMNNMWSASLGVDHISYERRSKVDGRSIFIGNLPDDLDSLDRESQKVVEGTANQAGRTRLILWRRETPGLSYSTNADDPFGTYTQPAYGVDHAGARLAHNHGDANNSESHLHNTGEVTQREERQRENRRDLRP
ncbi:hypothetical protein PG988_011212 [Apiospora saccharicola]